MRSIVRTATGTAFQLAKTTGIPLVVIPNSTLNEAVNNTQVNPYVPAIATEGMENAEAYNPTTDFTNMKLQYLAIGSGGHFAVNNGSQGRPRIGVKPHKARDTGFYDQVPFVCKPLDQDLSPQQREKYRLRTVVLINGVKYAAYWLKVIDLSKLSITQNIVKKDKGTKTAQPYKPTANDLVPRDPEISGENDGTYIQTLINTEIRFDAEEAEYFREVAELWFGSAEDAIISEIALCHGVDKPIVERYPDIGTQNPQRINSSLKEAVAVQVSIIESTFIPLNFSNGYAGETIGIGSEDPLYGTNYATYNQTP